MVEIISLILALFGPIGTIIGLVRLYLWYKERHKYDNLIQVD